MRRSLFHVFFVAAALTACGSGGSGSVVPDAASDAKGSIVDAGTGDGDGATTGCRSDVECRATSEYCISREQPSCGGEVPSNCATDQDCADAGADKVCAPLECGGSRCAPKCKSDADCPSKPAGLRFCETATGHCVPAVCTATSCPANFVCDTPAGCTRKSCTADSDCAGACVNRSCFDGPGACMSLPN